MARPPRHGQRHEIPKVRSVRFLVAVLLIGLAGCGSQTPTSQAPTSQVADTADAATAPPVTSGEQTPGEATGDSPTGGSGSATTTLHACDLLTPNDLAELAVEPAEYESDPISCRWHKDDGSHMVGVTLATDLTMDTIRSAQDFTPLNLRSRDAVQYTSEGDSCLVAIELPDSSIGLVIGVAPGNVEKSCKLSSKAAKAVEPNLP